MNSCNVDEKTARTEKPHKHKSDCQGPGVRGEADNGGHREMWGDGTVLCFNSVGGHTICQNS